MGVLRYIFIALTVAGFVTAEPTGTVVELTATELQAKAGFLYNFAKFTDWPTNALPTADAPLTIGVLESAKLGAVLEQTVAGKKIDHHEIRIRRLQDIKEARSCAIFYMCQSEKDRLPELLAAVQGMPVLTVSDMDDFIDRGGMIGMRNVNGRVVFEVNLAAVRAAKVKLNSKLLRLAHRVVSPPNGRRY